MRSIKQITYISACAAVMIVSKELLSFLPNVELVTFLCITFAMHFPYKMNISIVLIFCFIQIMLYGIHFWTPMYFVVWPIYVSVTYLFKRKLKTDHACALLSAAFGLCFGLFFAIPYFLLSIQAGYVYFIQGIFFDIVHAISNYIIMTILYDPVQPVLKWVAKGMKSN